MLTTTHVPLSDAQAEIAGWLSSWVAEGKPSPLSFMPKFAGQSAAALRRAGQTDRWIRDAIVPVLETVIAGYPASVRPVFLDAVERHLSEALPAVDPALQGLSQGTPDRGQAVFDAWCEGASEAELPEILDAIRSVKEFARELKAAGRSVEAIRVQVLELLGTLETPVSPGERARLQGLALWAADEELIRPA
ncbi:hypothetical protein [Singulisphaera sp. PoT]|uniref:hypothetical protein n=1 Tax=Singulisphaera sp. PoT TaxID=3411797 RepID=UPI003BF5520B